MAEHTNHRITEVLVNTSVASLPPAADWSGPGWSQGAALLAPGLGPTHHLCALLSETGRSHASAVWLNFKAQLRYSLSLLLTQNGTAESVGELLPSMFILYLVAEMFMIDGRL